MFEHLAVTQKSSKGRLYEENDSDHTVSVDADD